MSRGILQWFAGLFGAELNSTSLKTWDFFFRKGAHFTLYFVLGFGLCGAFQRQKRMPPRVPALLLGAAFAATDEFHQLFTQRTAMVQDVLLDSCGVAAGCGAACLVRWIGKNGRIDAVCWPPAETGRFSTILRGYGEAIMLLPKG